MRYIKDIPDARAKIGLYHWNNKYIIRVESGLYEQTFKVDDYEVQGVEELEKCIDDEFMKKVLARFDDMHHSFFGSMQRNEIIF